MIPQNVAIDSDGAWIMPVRRRALPKRDAALAKIAEREQRKVRPEYGKGDAILPATLLQKKLGKTTFRLWCVLLTMRDETGETHPSLPGLARAAGLGEAQTSKSLARLNQFKLVENYGLMFRNVPCNCGAGNCFHMHKVYVRNVYGWLKASNDLQSQSALVPRATAKLVEKAAGQGGARRGAGRPKGKLDSQPRQIIKGSCGNSKVEPYKYQVLASYVVPTEQQRSAQTCAPVIESGREQARERLQAAWERFAAYRPKGLTMPITTQPKGEEPVQPVLSAAPDDLDEPAPACDVLDALLNAPDNCREFQMSGTGTPRQQRYTPEDMRAATTLSNQLTILRVPAPPRVQDGSSEGQRLALLKAAYRAAHEKVMRTDYWRPAGKQQTDKERRAWLEAAEALRVEEINPTAWARFSFHCWHKMGKKTAPLPSWVWSAKRVHEHAGWCHDATGNQHSNHPIPLPAVQELMRRLGKLRAALGYGRPTDVVVSEVLSDAERMRLLQEQAQQVEAGKRDIEQRIRNGEWVWG